MASLTPEVIGEVIEACRGTADETVGALGRALDGQFVGVTIGEAATYDPQAPPEGFDGPGLVVVLKVGDVGAVAVLPETSGMLPDWYSEPDATGKSKLNTLAQELGMLLLPETLEAGESHALKKDKLAEALSLAEVPAGAALVPISLKSDEKQGQLSFIWPLAKPGELVAKPAAAPEAPEKAPIEVSKSAGPPPLESGQEPADEADAEPDKPAEPSPLEYYTRSLFRVRVPLSVNLAEQKQSVHDILELVPGSIIKFDKSCDELLDVVVGDQRIAAGEVVKVGDKFGLRIRNMVLPQEQFVTIKTTLPE